jgi:hypothetical protein
MVDDELSDLLLNMMEAPDVRLWAKIQSSYEDIFSWGLSIFNPVWEDVAETGKTLTKLRRLPPESFGTSPSGTWMVSGKLLAGIVMSEDGAIHYFQTTEKGTAEISLPFVARDPTSTDIDGVSRLMPLVPMVNMLDFCWQAQAQKVNRVGAPVLFMKVVNPIKTATRDDMKLAADILKRWGKNTAFTIPDNMEIVRMDITDNEVALNTIEAIKTRIREYFSPISMMQKQGNTIGGNAAAEKELFDNWVSGVHTWIEDQFEILLQTYLDANAYIGYRAELTIQVAPSNAGSNEANQAQVGFQTKALTTNEIREKLGADAMSEKELVALAEHYRITAPQSPFSPSLAQGNQPPGANTSPFTQKEHTPTKQEKTLEAEISDLTDDLATKVLKALDEEYQ